MFNDFLKVLVSENGKQSMVDIGPHCPLPYYLLSITSCLMNAAKGRMSANYHNIEEAEI